ncbi:MAG TPA: hypothetical protein VF463_11730 [Sphingobium sp.]
MAVAPVISVPGFFPEWTLRDNPALVRDIKAAVAHLGLSIAAGEGRSSCPARI